MALTDTLRQEALVKKAKELTSVLGNDNDNINDNGNKREKDSLWNFFFLPFDENLQLKIQEKIDKYDHLCQELKTKKSKALEE